MRIALAAVVFLALGSVSSTEASPGDAPAPTCSAAPAVVLPAPEVSVLPAAGGAVFQGCWTRFSAGTCRGIFSVDGGYKQCGACGPGGTPPKYNGQCTTISAATLASGYWCS